METVAGGTRLGGAWPLKEDARRKISRHNQGLYARRAKPSPPLPGAGLAPSRPDRGAGHQQGNIPAPVGATVNPDILTLARVLPKG
jgi:hypothetical protein